MTYSAAVRAAGAEETEMRERFLQGMSQLASPVAVVTTDGPAGLAGVTVSDFVWQGMPA